MKQMIVGIAIGVAITGTVAVIYQRTSQAASEPTRIEINTAAEDYSRGVPGDLGYTDEPFSEAEKNAANDLANRAGDAYSRGRMGPATDMND